MKYIKGDKVIYLPTGETAKITKLVGEELVYIRMDSDKEEMPAFASDIAPVLQDNRPRQEQTVFATTTITSTFHKEDLKEGLYLIVQYKMGQLNPESNLPVFLYNHSNNKLHFDLNYFTNKATPHQIKGKLEPGGIDLIHHISFESLEQSPTFEIDWFAEHDPISKYQFDLIIKPAAFFKKHGSIAIVNSTGSLYYLQPKLKEKQIESQSLAGYTKAEQRLSPGVVKKKDPSKKLIERANFDIVLDLHIENIHPDPSKVKKGDLLPYQLKIFDEYIEKAIKLGINQVFIVHGLGNGKLKNEIATRLVMHPGVNTFKNEFHPSYGFGATEVWLY